MLVKFGQTTITSYVTSELPTLKEGEAIVSKGTPRKRGTFLLAILVTFIPPFIWGALLILLWYLGSKKNYSILTNQRLITVNAALGGSKFNVVECDLTPFVGISRLTTPGNSIRRYFNGECQVMLKKFGEDGKALYQQVTFYGDKSFYKGFTAYFANKPNQPANSPSPIPNQP